MNAGQPRHEPEDAPGQGRWFWFACSAEGALVLLAGGLALLVGRPLFGEFAWKLADATTGALASIPMALFFVWMLKRRPSLLSDIPEALETTLRPLFAGWNIAQLAMISLVAGFAEELLFRGVIQGKLAELIGTGSAILVTSVLFGLVHLVTVNYALVTGLVSIYLGLLMPLTGNLLAPMVTHAVYDFLALVYFLRVHAPPAPSPSAFEDP